MFVPRFYRKDMGGRFNSLVYRYRATDIWMAYDLNTSIPEDSILSFIDDKCRSLWKTFEDYFKIDPEYKDTFDPYDVPEDAPEVVKRLSLGSVITEVGPMAGIAGLYAEEIGKACKEHFKLNEIIVENGGDLYIDVKKTIKVSLFAGDHPLSNRIKLDIEASMCPMGLCASSGKFGHSKSLGKADLVSVACCDAVIADQYATAFANQVIHVADIEEVIEMAIEVVNLKHISIFKDKAFAIGGMVKVSVG